jgi:hypothetical protein
MTPSAKKPKTTELDDPRQVRRPAWTSLSLQSGFQPSEGRIKDFLFHEVEITTRKAYYAKAYFYSVGDKFFLTFPHKVQKGQKVLWEPAVDEVDLSLVTHTRELL